MSIALSIIIPTYNRLWSLPKTIESCRNNHIDTEIIVIDDGSTDGTWEWLQAQPDIITIRQQNLGKCWAVNKGFAIATGRYVRFLDSDDMLPPGVNDAQYHLAQQTGADIIAAGYNLIDTCDNIIRRIDWVRCDDFLAQQLGECEGSHYSAFLFKRSFLADIPHRPDFAFRDDRLFILEAALKDPSIAVFDQPALLHRMHNAERLQHNDLLTSAVQNYQHYQLYKRILNELENRGKLTERYKKAPANILWHLAHWVAYTDIATGHHIYKWVYQLYPDFKPANNKTIAAMYKILGFVLTERLLRLRRQAPG